MPGTQNAENRSPSPTLPTLRFLGGLLAAGGANAGDLDLVIEWLTEGLAWLGAGAKTATGYGRLAVVS